MKLFLTVATLVAVLFTGACSKSDTSATDTLATACSQYECDDVEVIYPAPGKKDACVRSGMTPPDASPIIEVVVDLPFGGPRRLAGTLMIMQVGERCDDVFYGRFVPDVTNTAPFEVTLRIGSRTMTQLSEKDRPQVAAFTKGLYEPSSSAAITACVHATEQSGAIINGMCVSW